MTKPYWWRMMLKGLVGGVTALLMMEIAVGHPVGFVVTLGWWRGLLFLGALELWARTSSYTAFRKARSDAA